jgi:hypothetical protein
MPDGMLLAPLRAGALIDLLAGGIRPVKAIVSRDGDRCEPSIVPADAGRLRVQTIRILPGVPAASTRSGGDIASRPGRASLFATARVEDPAGTNPPHPILEPRRRNVVTNQA